MMTFVTVVHVVICVVLVVVVLIQPSREGGGLGGAFGGSSQTIFGSSGGANFFTKFTSGLAALFMITSLAITLSKSGSKKSVFDQVTNSQAPATSASGAKTGATGDAPITTPGQPQQKDAPKTDGSGQKAPANTTGAPEKR